jgi:hypothetical protein
LQAIKTLQKYTFLHKQICKHTHTNLTLEAFPMHGRLHINNAEKIIHQKKKNHLETAPVI